MNIAIVGLGGVGGHLLGLLSHDPDIDAFTLIDPDIYEKKNIERQPMTEVGQAKVIVAKNKIPVNKQVTIAQKNIAPGMTESCRIVFCCVDNNEGRRDCLDAITQSRSMCIFTGNNKYDGSAFVYVPWPVWQSPRQAYPELFDVNDEIPQPHITCAQQTVETPQTYGANLKAAMCAYLLFQGWQMLDPRLSKVADRLEQLASHGYPEAGLLRYKNRDNMEKKPEAKPVGFTMKQGRIKETYLELKKGN